MLHLQPKVAVLVAIVARFEFEAPAGILVLDLAGQPGFARHHFESKVGFDAVVVVLLKLMPSNFFTNYLRKK
jgi:hypothetical protein